MTSATAEFNTLEPAYYSVFDLNVQVESTTGGTGSMGKSKTKHPRDPRGLLFLNTKVKNALVSDSGAGIYANPPRIASYSIFLAYSR